jgi:hypothetical protein
MLLDTGSLGLELPVVDFGVTHRASPPLTGDV